MEKDLREIKKLLLEYIKIIIKEYPNCKSKEVIEKINSKEELVEYNTKNTITFIVTNKNKLLLPATSYKIFPELQKYKNYGINKNNKRKVEEYLDTNTTYMQYIEHVIEAGLSVYEYFEESLLHEAMHILGSDGGTPLEEGITELKTRELAQKHNLKIAGYAYSKEVEMAKRLQERLGKEIMDELTFIPRRERYNFLLTKLGTTEAELYKYLSEKMREKSLEFFEKNLGINNPFEKAKLYEMIDYKEIINIIDNDKTKYNM